MARGTWSVQKYDGISFSSDGSIYRPNAQLALTMISTQQKSKLATGDNAFFTPSTAYTKEPLTFQWLEILSTDALIAKLQGYIQNNSYVRITTHTGEILEGNFLSLERVWLISVAPDTFDLQATFEVQA